VLDSNGQLAMELHNDSDNEWFSNEWIDIDDFQVSVHVPEHYEYALDLDASLIDSSESLSDIILTKMPDDITLKDADGNEIVQNADGSYTVTLDANGDSNLTIVSSDELSSDERGFIVASVTSTDTEHNDTATTTIAGSDNDTITIDNSDSVDGGAGLDTLLLQDDITLDFLDSNIATIKNVEKIDLGNNGDHSILNLSLEDVLDMTDANHTLTILGDSSNDVVSVLNDGENVWSKGGQVVENGHTFDVYTNSGDSSVILKIEDIITDSIV
jgi:hypothetical protein